MQRPHEKGEGLTLEFSNPRNSVLFDVTAKATPSSWIPSISQSMQFGISKIHNDPVKGNVEIFLSYVKGGSWGISRSFTLSQQKYQEIWSEIHNFTMPQ